MLVTIQQVHLVVSIMNKLLSVIFLCVALSTLDAQIYQPNYKGLYGPNGPANGLGEPPFYPERERLDLPESYLHALRQRANPERIYPRGNFLSNIGVRSDDSDDTDDEPKDEFKKRVNLILKLGVISDAAFKDVGNFLLSLSGDEGKSIFDLGNIRIFHQLIKRATSAGLVIKDIILYLGKDCMTLFHIITTNPYQILIFVLFELLKMIGLPPWLFSMVRGMAETMLGKY